MNNHIKLGKSYEQHAYFFLINQGLRLIAKNSFCRWGEIDLIMQDQLCLVFIEVRYRKNSLYGDAQSTVTISKQKKTIKAAYVWMQQQNIDIENCEFRFDVFATTGNNSEWIKNAFS